MKPALRHLIAAACLFTGTCVFGTDGKIAGSAETSTQIAQEWLKLLDDGAYGASWKSASARFRASVTEERWVAAMNQMRQPLGLVNSRELLDATFTDTIPRAPKGEYWLLKFKTSFEAVTANEIVALVADGPGEWRVLTFSIRPAA